MVEPRKIAAILCSDVVGYRGLAGADEDRIVARLREPPAIPDWHVREDRDHGAAGAVGAVGRHDHRVEERGAFRAYQGRTLAADALIAGSYLAGTDTRRVRRALSTLFAGERGKDTVSRVWRKVKSD